MADGLFYKFPYPPQQRLPKVTASGPTVGAASLTADAIIGGRGLVFACAATCGLMESGADPGAVESHEDHWEFATAAGVSISATAGPGSRPAFRYNPSAAQAQMRRFFTDDLVAGGFRLRVDTLPGSTVAIAEVSNPNGNGRIYLTAAGALQVEVGASARTTFGTVSADASWHWITFLWDATTGTASLKARLDGGTEQTQTNVQTAAASTDWHQGFQTSVTGDIYITDTVLSTLDSHYPMATQRVVGLWPDSDGTHSFTTGDFKYDNTTNISPSATDVHTYLSDTGIDTGSDFISANTNATSAYVEVGFANSGFSNDPIGVMVVIGLHSSGTATNAIKLNLNDGGTLSPVTQPFTTGFQDVSALGIVTIERAFAIPPSGGTWSAAEVDALKVRYGYYDGVGAIPFWDAVLLEVPFADVTTVEASFTADAVISKAQTGSFTADAVLRKDQTGSFTANAVISKAQTGSFTADAVLRRDQTGSFTGDAVIQRSQTGSFTANAVISRSQSNTFAADAVLRVTQAGSLTANAVVQRTQTASFSADAQIAVLILDDNFNRTVDPGWGTSSDGRARYVQFYLFDGDRFRTSVDGSAGTVDPDALTGYAQLSGWPAPVAGTIQWDFYVPADVEAYVGYYVFIQNQIQVAAYSEQDGTWSVYSNEPFYNFTPDPDTWYTVKANVGVGDPSSSWNYVKVWPQGDPEPDWLDGDENFSPTSPTDITFITVEGVERPFIDNLKIWTSVGSFQTAFTADAVIRRDQSATFTANAFIPAQFTANAVISRGQTGSFTADAFISGDFTMGFGAYAVISTVQTASFTADAVISKTISETTEPIIFVSRAAAGTNTVALPTFAVGDLAIVSAFRSGSNTPPTVPGTFTAIDSSGANTCSQSVGYRVLQSGDTTIGTWTNASSVQVLVFRNQHATTPIGVFAANGASSDQMAYAALTLQDQTGRSWVLGVGGHRTATNVGVQTVGGTETTARATTNTTISAHTAEGVPSWSAHNFDAVVNASSGWRTYAIEIRAFSDSGLSANAWIRAFPTSSLTADAVVSAPVSQTFTADAVLQASLTQTFTADAVLSRSQTASFTADAVISRSQAASFTADAVLQASRSQTFTADAVIQVSRSATFTADAVIALAQSASFSADSILQASRTQTFTGDAVIQASMSASFTADAIIARSFTADAIIAASVSQTFTADAWINPVFRADAVIAVGQSTTFTADAFIFGAFTLAFSVDAVIQRAQAASFTADAVISRGQTASVTADAVIAASRSQTFTADAVVQASVTQTFTANAVIQASRSQTFAADAVLARGQTASLTADSIFAASISASFTANAVVSASVSASFTVNAVLRVEQAASLTANAVIRRDQTATFSADTVIRVSVTQTFSADAVLRVDQSASFTADAQIAGGTEASFTANAVIQAAQTSSFTVDAYLSRIGKCVWTTPGDTVPIDPDPALTFIMPDAAGPMHFHMELDTDPDFDSVTLRSYKSNHDQTDWEYWDGGAWQPIPAGGVPTAFSGNEARLTISDPLAIGLWYRRVRGGA